MTWLRNLFVTYEKNKQLIGKFEMSRNNQEYALIPVAHTTQTAQIEVTLDMDGNFISAKVVDKDDASTVIPCTEASSSRTSSPVPHPLHDKLMYVGGDFERYGGLVKKNTPFTDYIKQLEAWCESDFGHPKIKSVYNYLSKSKLIEDLVNEKIILVDGNNRFVEKWKDELKDKYGEKPDLFKVITGDQSSAFVRFAVNKLGEPDSRLWRDKSVHDSFIQFYEHSLIERDLCYVSGEMKPSTDRHTSRIRNSADMAKLISANDSAGFTFRGRFETSNQAVAISYDISQKGHNALKWLIAKQGIYIDGRVFLVWSTDKLEMPDPLGGNDFFGLYEDEVENSDTTHQVYANEVRKAIGGYKHDLTHESKVIIMVIDAATPGRMSIVYYREMEPDFFLDQLEAWHKSCYWQHFDFKTKRSYVGAPATRDIAFAAYGSRADDKLVKGLMERMLPCIIDGRPIPTDIVRNAFYRSSNPVGYDHEWEWEKTLGITCALFNKVYEKEGYSVTLDVNNQNRDYLFGRLLAVADVLERSALDKNEKRATNAVRYMNAFAKHPSRTWGVIQASIQPYQAKLGMKLLRYDKLIDEIGSKIAPEDFTDKPLSGLYLLGFYSQRNDLYKKKDQNEIEKGVVF